MEAGCTPPIFASKSIRKKAEPWLFFFNALAGIFLIASVMYDYGSGTAQCDFDDEDKFGTGQDGKICFLLTVDPSISNSYLCCERYGFDSVPGVLTILSVIFISIEVVIFVIWAFLKFFKNNE